MAQVNSSVQYWEVHGNFHLSDIFILTTGKKKKKKEEEVKRIERKKTRVAEICRKY